MDPPQRSLPAEMSVAEAAAFLGISRKRTVEYTHAGVLSHRAVPSRYNVPLEWRVATEQVLALAAARTASRARYDELRGAGWCTVAELTAQHGVVASTMTRAMVRGDLQAEQFPHEPGTPYRIAPWSLLRWHPAPRGTRTG